MVGAWENEAKPLTASATRGLVAAATAFSGVVTSTTIDTGGVKLPARRLLEEEGVVDPRRGYKLPAAYAHEELGVMIGVERVAVTRVLGRLRDEGAVELRRRRIHVTDPEVLPRIAEQGRKHGP